MDDLKLLRELEAGVPRLGTQARESARHRLHAAIAADDRPADAVRRPARQVRRPRGLWKPTIAGALATVAAGTVAYTYGQDASRPGSQPTVAVQQVAAVQVLYKAARVVERQPETRPQPHQWVYVKTVFSTRGKAEAPLEDWTRFDGRQTASMNWADKPPKLQRDNTVWDKGDDRTPSQEYDALKALPTDPGALLKSIYQKVDTARPRLVKSGQKWTREDRNDWAFRYVTAILGTKVPVPPSLQAAVYRATAKIPGVRVERDVVDAAGRHGLAVGRESAREGIRFEIVLAPGTYQYLGTRFVTTRPKAPPTRSSGSGAPAGARPTPGGSGRPAGQVQSQARVAFGVTDQAGQRP